MKKILIVISKILLVLNIILLIIVLYGNINTILKILIKGMTVGNDYPNSIFWGKMTFKGASGVIEYYSITKELFLLIDVPIIIITSLYIIIYNIITKKRKTSKRRKSKNEK